MVNQEGIRKLEKVHPYPAKYTIDTIAAYIDKYSEKGDLIYDPFVGCGTTLLTANMLERIGIGADINGIAVLISQFKITAYTISDIKRLESFIGNLRNHCLNFDTSNNKSYKSIEHWFNKNAITTLSAILQSIERDLAGFPKGILLAKVVFSSILTNVSNQESDTRYSATEKKNVDCEYIFAVYEKKFRQLLGVVSEIEYSDCTAKSSVKLQNSKKSSEVFGENSVDFIITSPPYPNTYDYYLYHKHRMLWLDYSVNDAMRQEIGSRREFSSLKKPADNFTNDLFEILVDCNKMLKANKYAAFIIGDGQISGERYDSRNNMIKLAEKLKWRLVFDDCNSLDDISKAFQKSFRVKGKLEHVLVFQKIEK